MLGFFERQRLVKKGLASTKVRRRRTESELMETLEHGGAARFAICVAFFAGLAVLIYSDLRDQPTRSVLIAALIFLTALVQLWINHPHTWARNSRLLAMLGVCLVHLVIIKLIFVTAENQIIGPRGGFFEPDARAQLWKLAVPYAFAPLTLSVLLGKYHGLFAAVFVSMWGSLIAPGENHNAPINAVFLVTSLISGIIAVFVTLRVRRRSRLIRAGVFVGLATWLLALIFGQIGEIDWVNLRATHWTLVGYQSVAAIGSGILTAFVVGGMLPVLESMFRITTDISWLELADLNHPLLKRMTIEAPGTYHHSLVVANLAEAAAETIGANATMCRVGAYFHDIGKLVKPEYFTENMRRDRNPHDELAPTMSALIIIAHVKEGVDLALKHGLNQEIIDVIQQHHGTSTVFYFYKRALQQQEDARAGGKILNVRDEDIPHVREESFRYPGPRPQTKECAIISLADSIESASRSLERVTPQKIDQLIGDIIQRRVIDGQLKECDLTMRELEDISESFRHTLQSMMHSRISYPTGKTEKLETPSPTRSGLLPPVSTA